MTHFRATVTDITELEYDDDVEPEDKTPCAITLDNGDLCGGVASHRVELDTPIAAGGFGLCEDHYTELVGN